MLLAVFLNSLPLFFHPQYLCLHITILLFLCHVCFCNFCQSLQSLLLQPPNQLGFLSFFNHLLLVSTQTIYNVSTPSHSRFSACLFAFLCSFAFFFCSVMHFSSSAALEPLN